MLLDEEHVLILTPHGVGYTTWVTVGCYSHLIPSKVLHCLSSQHNMWKFRQVMFLKE
jgi:hypothetical protein